MKKFLALILLFSSFLVHADVHVRGYTKRDGTYVQGYTRSSPNSSTSDNYSAKGNTNPYTGKVGTVNKKSSIDESGRTIHTGPRGGKYYINKNGKKTYIPRR